MPPDPTVFVVDDDPAVRQSFKWLVGSIGLKVQTFSCAQDFIRDYDPADSGCLVVDVRMPGMSGIELQEKLANDGISIPIIVVTAYGDVPTAVRAMKRGAVDFIEKPYNDQAMLDRIQLCIERDAKMRREKEIRREVTWRVERLTPREREVFELIVAGRSNKEVARALDISPKTVEAHRAKVMDKMAVGSLAELVQLSTYLESK